jgi:hypothetical protein
MNKYIKQFLILVIIFLTILWVQTNDDKKKNKVRTTYYDKMKIPLLATSIVGLFLNCNIDKLFNNKSPKLLNNNSNNLINPSSNLIDGSNNSINPNASIYKIPISQTDNIYNKYYNQDNQDIYTSDFDHSF